MINAAAIAIALASGVIFGEYLAQPLKREARRLEGRLSGPRLVGPLRARTVRRRTGRHDRPALADLEAGRSPRPARRATSTRSTTRVPGTLVHPGHQAVDARRRSPRSAPAPSRRHAFVTQPRDTRRPRLAPARVAEEHALHPAVHHDVAGHASLTSPPGRQPDGVEHLEPGPRLHSVVRRPAGRHRGADLVAGRRGEPDQVGGVGVARPGAPRTRPRRRPRPGRSSRARRRGRGRRP